MAPAPTPAGVLSSRVVQGLGAAGLGYYGRDYVPLEWLERQWEGLVRGTQGTSDSRELARALAQLGSKVDAALGAAPRGTATPPAPPSTVIVQNSAPSTSRTTTLVAYGVALCGATYCYLRYWKGVRLEDVTFATHASVRDAVAGVGASLEAVRAMVVDARHALGRRIEDLKETIRTVRADVGKVHDDVRDVKSDVDATRALAESCDRRLEETSAKQDYANRGIQALCSVVGELLQNAARTPAIENLRTFSRLGRPPGTTTSSPQQQQLASDSSSSSSALLASDDDGSAAAAAGGGPPDAAAGLLLRPPPGSSSSSNGGLSDDDLDDRVRAVQAIAREHGPPEQRAPKDVD